MRVRVSCNRVSKRHSYHKFCLLTHSCSKQTWSVLYALKCLLRSVVGTSGGQLVVNDAERSESAVHAPMTVGVCWSRAPDSHQQAKQT